MSLTTFLENSKGRSFSNFGRVERTINGYYPGRVYFKATYWPARLQQPQETCKLSPGSWVRVMGREGLTLLVSPVQDTSLSTHV
ncbi:MAG: NfeD family protein [Leptolyngbya sp. SIO1E4]|nr:NfeD family protein [Leptolyngbya sp. SIO1E4]